MNDVYHVILWNMISNANLGNYDFHYNQQEEMLEQNFRLFWETSYGVFEVSKPPPAGHFFNLWLLDGNLVQTERDALYYINQMVWLTRDKKRPDGLPYHCCMAYNELTVAFRKICQERETNE